jgi:hypothetical protein
MLAMLAVPGLVSIAGPVSPDEDSPPARFEESQELSNHLVSRSEQRTNDDDGMIDVQELGADPSGSEPLDDLLQNVAADDTHLFFPEGRYRLGELSGEFENLVLEGTEATIVPDDRSTLWRLLDVRGSRNVVDGFVFDYRDAEVPPEISIRGADGWAFRNCLFRGVQNTNLRQRGGFALLPAVTSEHGTGTIENVYMQDGSAPPSGGDTRGGIWFGPNNKGTLHIDGVWMEAWAENTIYGHNTPGEVIIENSFFRNTNVAGTRIGGNTTLRNNTYVKTGPVPKQTHPNRNGEFMRGVWITGGRREFGSSGSVVIENCDFHFTNGDSTGPSIVQPAAIDGDLTIRNCHIRQDTDRAIWIDAPTNVSFVNVHITGETEEYAIFVDPEATINAVSGNVDTSGRISNRSEITDAVSGENVAAPDPSPPDNLTDPRDADSGVPR